MLFTFITGFLFLLSFMPNFRAQSGLCTGDGGAPFPEEINRRITTSIATFHFPPTDQARQNLLNEGVNENNILVTGNTVIDALLSVCKFSFHIIFSSVAFSSSSV